MDMSKITASETCFRAMMNLWNRNQEGLYGICHSYRPVSDFPPRSQTRDFLTESNVYKKAYPCLYPYGCGGIEATRPVAINFKDHIKWSMEYFDRRFRKNETFLFYCFGILQRREALLSARLQMNRQAFERVANILGTITKEKLLHAQNEEQQGNTISDPAVRLLQKTVQGALTRVTGSNEARYQMRGQIWSTSVYLGPPSLWITINPSDINNPIAQIFAGEKIDYNTLASTLDSQKRAKNIANNPYAAAKFFHFLIGTILQKLFCVNIKGHQVNSGLGILGRVQAYFGLVESQGRGTLHLHMILWLANSPRLDMVPQLLQNSDFRQRVVDYIRENLRAYLPGLETAESIQEIDADKEIACKWPPNPHDTNYDTLLKEDELSLARTEQIHICKRRRCLFPDHKGIIRCKRCAPFPCSDQDFVLETGDWGSKRLHGYVNAWIPGVLLNARCNNDVKLLTNGGDTKNITYYVTTYVAKKQGQAYNVAAVLTKGFNYHKEHPLPEYISQLKESSCMLIFRLVHAINREQEIAALMAMSYLMGWGDVYRSHTYSSIYWTGFVSKILQTFPDLNNVAS
jgi:Helitron helicase-like domain at N-terminus